MPDRLDKLKSIRSIVAVSYSWINGKLKIQSICFLLMDNENIVHMDKWKIEKSIHLFVLVLKLVVSTSFFLSHALCIYEFVDSVKFVVIM